MLFLAFAHIKASSKGSFLYFRCVHKPFNGFAGLHSGLANPLGGLIAINQNMLGKIKSIVQFAPRKRLVNIEVEGVTAKTYIVEGYSNSKRWREVNVGDLLDGLIWDDEEAKIIDADSSITVLKRT